LTKLRFSFAFFLAVVSAASIFAIATASRAQVPPGCPSDSKHAIAQARKALETGDPKLDHAALVCLVEAVAALDVKLEGLRDGSVPFTGKAHTSTVVLRNAHVSEGQ